MANYHDIRYNHNFPSAATGAMVHIKTLTASSSATLSFVDGASDVVLDNTYKTYIFRCTNIHPSAVQTLHFNASVDTGSNYNVSKTTTYFRASHDEANTATSLAYVDADLANGTGTQRLSAGIDTANDAAGCGTLQIFNPSSTTFVKHFLARFQVENQAASQETYVAGYCNTTSAVDAIQFSMSSGNIDSGTIKLYGIKDS